MPLPEPVDPRLLVRLELPAVDVPVVPVDYRRQALVVDRPRQGRSDPCSLLPLLLVEGPPFGPMIEEGGRDDHAAALADEFSGLVVPDEVNVTALRTLGDFFIFHQVTYPSFSYS